MIYLMSLIQKKIFRLITRTASQITPSAWDAKFGLKKPIKEKTAAKSVCRVPAHELKQVIHHDFRKVV